jgi:hypothetical protein
MLTEHYKPPYPNITAQRAALQLVCAVYHYTTQLGPKFLGLLPYLIAVAWFMMSYPSFVIADWLVPSGWKRWQRVLAVAAVGGLSITAAAPSSSPRSFSMVGMPPPPTSGILEDCPVILIAMPLCRFFIHEGSDQLGRIHEGRVIFIHPGPGDNRRSLILHTAPLEFIAQRHLEHVADRALRVRTALIQRYG